MMDSQWVSLLPLVIVVGLVAWVVVVVRKGRRDVPEALAAAGDGVPTARRSGGFGGVVEVLCWLVTMVFCAVGAVRLFALSMQSGASAPQYAAEAAGVCAAVLVPYVFSRAVQALRGR